jgi:RNA polymerase sigma factor (sigma-70 family)
MSALLQAPEADRPSAGAASSDHKLVAAVRRGDDRAFEALYASYHRRIHAYVLGMVKDHQRAEDVTQEVFVSALRRMRATERPIAFKPWIYEIAKNACIDQFRRSRRAEEVSYDAEEGLAPSDYGRLVSHEPVPDAALVAKQQLDDLCGAFGGLSDAHHEILVLRELEGLSYREIGERMGMSRPAVESTLFRARRRLTEEYDELASGHRCLRVQSIIATAATGRLGARDTRRLARHVAHCQPCRREAVAAGVDAALVARTPLRRRVADKVAALFPFPLLLRFRKGGGSGDSWLGQLPAVSDQAANGTAKLAAAAVVLVAGLGAGMDTHIGAADASRDRPADVSPKRTSARDAAADRTRSTVTTPASTRTERREADRRPQRRATRRERANTIAGAGAPAAAKQQTSGGGTPTTGGGTPTTGSGGAPVHSGSGGGGGGATGTVPAAVGDKAPDAPTPDTGGGDGGPPIEVHLPAVQLPGATNPQGSQVDPGAVVGGVVGGAGGAVGDTGDAAGGALEDTTDAVDETVESLPVLP